MNINKFLAFITGILLAFALTATIGMLVSAVYLWFMLWLKDDIGLSFWQTAWVVGLISGFFALIRSIPALQKGANELVDDK